MAHRVAKNNAPRNRKREKNTRRKKTTTGRINIHSHDGVCLNRRLSPGLVCSAVGACSSFDFNRGHPTGHVHTKENKIRQRHRKKKVSRERRLEFRGQCRSRNSLVQSKQTDASKNRNNMPNGYLLAQTFVSTYLLPCLLFLFSFQPFLLLFLSVSSPPVIVRGTLVRPVIDCLF